MHRTHSDAGKITANERMQLQQFDKNRMHRHRENSNEYFVCFFSGWFVFGQRDTVTTTDADRK